MAQNILALECQKLILTMSTVISASTDRLCLKDILKEEQVLPDKRETELKVDLQERQEKRKGCYPGHIKETD